MGPYYVLYLPCNSSGAQPVKRNFLGARQVLIRGVGSIQRGHIGRYIGRAHAALPDYKHTRALKSP